MTNPWDRAEEALVALEQRTQYDERNRLELLTVHAVIGLAVGILIWMYGPPDAWLSEFGDDSSMFLFLPALAGGATLGAGLAWKRNILLEAVGMLLILLWDCLMIFTLYKGGLNPYAVAVYCGMAALMSIHIRTLYRYLKARTVVPHDE